jgi:hypothetical protein
LFQNTQADNQKSVQFANSIDSSIFFDLITDATGQKISSLYELVSLVTFIKTVGGIKNHS